MPKSSAGSENKPAPPRKPVSSAVGSTGETPAGGLPEFSGTAGTAGGGTTGAGGGSEGTAGTPGGTPEGGAGIPPGKEGIPDGGGGMFPGGGTTCPWDKTGLPKTLERTKARATLLSEKFIL